MRMQILISVVLLSYSLGAAEGTRTERVALQDGSVEQCDFINDTKNGLYVLTSPDGLVQTKGQYLNGMRHGVWVTEKNGRVEKIVGFKLDKLAGPFCEFYDTGELCLIRFYSDDRQVGEIVVFTKDGKLKQVYFDSTEKVKTDFHGVSLQVNAHGMLTYKANDGTWKTVNVEKPGSENVDSPSSSRQPPPPPPPSK